MNSFEQFIFSSMPLIEEIKLSLSKELPSRSLLEQYQPKLEWFSRSQSANSIHGIGHEARVMVWQEMLARLLIKSGSHLDQEALRWAAATHDTQRLDDGYDWNHGERSAIWVSQNLQLASPSLETVAYLNRWHVPSDSQAPEMTPELAVFKDADGLDRARIGDLDSRFLRHSQSRQLLVRPAESLFQLSSLLQRKDEMDPFQSVMEAATRLTLITDN